METQKVILLLNDSSNEEPNFATKKQYVKDSQTTKGKYKQGDTIKFETETVKSSLCDYSDAFVSVTGKFKVTADNNADVAFKNCAPFSTCTTKINDIFVDKANHIYIAMPMYNLNITIIIQIHQEVHGSLKEMKFLIIMLI